MLSVYPPYDWFHQQYGALFYVMDMLAEFGYWTVSLLHLPMLF